MAIRWRGLIAPVDVPTGDGRMFAAGRLTHRPPPLPLMARFTSGGHDGAVGVGTIDRVFEGEGGYWGEGEFFDPAMVPEVSKCIYLLQKKTFGPSVDLDRDFTVEAVAHPSRNGRKAGLFLEGNVIGCTLVPMPAFYQVHMTVDTEPEMALLASAGVDIEALSPFFDINTSGWRAWDLAPRDYKFDADDAVKRIAHWAGIGSDRPNMQRYASAFLWRDGNQAGDTMAQDSFRMPLADIVDGRPLLVYHAVYAAAALLSGAHGGLPNVPDEDKRQAKQVINSIYEKMADKFGDQGMKSPFSGPPKRAQEMSMEDATENDCGCNTDPEQVDFSSVSDEEGQMGMMTPTPAVTVSGNSITIDATGPLTITLTPPPPPPMMPRALPPLPLLDVLRAKAKLLKMQEGHDAPVGAGVGDGECTLVDGRCSRCGY